MGTMKTKDQPKHSHTPGRKDGVLAVGKHTKLKMGYNKTPRSFIKGLKDGDSIVFMEQSSDGTRFLVKKGNLMGEDPYHDRFLNIAHAPKGSKDKICKLVPLSWVRPDTLEGQKKIKRLCLESQSKLVMKFERDIDKMRERQERQVDAAYKKLEQLENYRESLYDKLYYAY